MAKLTEREIIREYLEPMAKRLGLDIVFMPVGHPSTDILAVTGYARKCARGTILKFDLYIPEKAYLDSSSRRLEKRIIRWYQEVIGATKNLCELQQAAWEEERKRRSIG